MITRHLFTFLMILFLLSGCSGDKEQIILGEVSNEYSVYDGNVIKFTDIPVGREINSFILEVENKLFEVEPSDFEKYGGGRMVEIKYLIQTLTILMR